MDDAYRLGIKSNQESKGLERKLYKWAKDECKETQTIEKMMDNRKRQIMTQRRIRTGTYVQHIV